MDLRTVTSKLIRDPDPAQWVRLADSYIQAYLRVPDKFVLPAQHAFLQPIIESFAKDTQALARYIMALRDAVDGGARDELHALYRTISMRALQTGRRARIRRAVTLLVDAHEAATQAKVSAEATLKVARIVEQSWGDMRMEAMADARNELKSKRLPSEDRALALEAFWSNIDAALDNKTVPLTEWATQQLTEAMNE